MPTAQGVSGDCSHARQSPKANHIFSQLKLAIKNQLRLLRKRSSTHHVEPQSTSHLPNQAKSQSTLHLLDIAFTLARVDNKPTSSINSYPLRRVEWPVVMFGLKFELLVPPPCVDHASEIPPISISGFIDRIPERMRDVHKKANPEKLVDLMLPQDIICHEARHVAAVFWLWLCITDDILESMSSDAKFYNGIADIQATLSGQYQPPSYNSRVSYVTRLLKEFIDRANIGSSYKWRGDFINCVLEIVDAFRRERPLVQAGDKIGLINWMLLRVLTISARPFMVLARASLGLPTTLSAKGNPYHPKYKLFNSNESAEPEDGFARLEATMQCIMGLQNDILGFEKDNRANHYLNAVQILILQGVKDKDALTEVIRVHNCLSSSAVAQGYKLMHTLQGWPHSSTSSRNNSTSSLDLSLSNSNHTSHSSSLPSPVSRSYNDTVQVEDNNSDGIVSQGPSQTASRVSSRIPSTFLMPKSHPQEVNHLDVQHLTPQIFTSRFEDQLWATYITVLLGFGNAMATWHICSKRYAVKA